MRLTLLVPKRWRGRHCHIICSSGKNNHPPAQDLICAPQPRVPLLSSDAWTFSPHPLSSSWFSLSTLHRGMDAALCQGDPEPGGWGGYWLQSWSASTIHTRPPRIAAAHRMCGPDEGREMHCWWHNSWLRRRDARGPGRDLTHCDETHAISTSENPQLLLFACYSPFRFIFYFCLESPFPP